AILASALRLTVAESVKISVPLSVENKAKLNAIDNWKDRVLFPPPSFRGAAKRRARNPLLDRFRGPMDSGPAPNGASRNDEVERPKLIRPDHLEHGFGANFEIIALAAGADDRAGQPGLVDALPDHGLVDMDGNDLTQRQPGLRLFAVGTLELDDLCHLAFERHRAFGDARHVHDLAWRLRQPGELELVDIRGDMRRG